jgi:hypothetical protein
VVPKESAVVPGQANAEVIVIHEDHVGMARYPSREHTGYRTISGHLQIMADAAVEKIARRWEEEKRVNESGQTSEHSMWQFTDTMRLSVLSGRSGAMFSIPFSLLKVPEVQHFVAREEELAQIHHLLSVSSGRRTVVIHSLGGMGKTQLAVEYAKRHRPEYSAIFWLEARDEASLKQGFAQVARRIFGRIPVHCSHEEGGGQPGRRRDGTLGQRVARQSQEQ